MECKTQLYKILKEFASRQSQPPTHAVFFAENEGDEVDHLLCYQEQIPAIQSFSKWFKPYLLIVRELGKVHYVYGDD